MEYEGSRNPIYIDGATARVEIRQGIYALIDAADIPLIAPYKWRVSGAAEYSLGVTRYANAQDPITKRAISQHRLILGLAPGDRTQIGDHINGDGLDNRRCNLRLATPGQNSHNRQQIMTRGRGVDGYRGVMAYTKSSRTLYAAVSVFDGRAVVLKPYETAADAARAHDAFVAALHGDIATLNFPAPRKSARKVAA